MVDKVSEKVPDINLLPNSANGLMNQILNWALSIGRLLIILTEMVALGTFIFRFSLDMQIVDLHDKIKAESFIESNFQDAETKFRDIQDRLATVKQYAPLTKTSTGILTDIISMGKGKVTFLDLSVSTQDIKIEVAAPSASSLSQFVDSLKNYPSITSVSVDKVDSDPASALITVTISAALKQAGFVPDTSQTNGVNTTSQPTATSQ